MDMKTLKKKKKGNEIIDIISKKEYLTAVAILSELPTEESDAMWDEDEELAQIITDSRSLYVELLDLKEQLVWAYERGRNK